MSEYWISQERYYCKYCKVWMSDNKQSIRWHENGRRHQEVVANLERDKKREKLHGARNEADLKRQLREIEEAAKAQVEKDLVSMQFAGQEEAPPPPPPPPTTIGASIISRPAQLVDMDSLPPPPPPPPELDANLMQFEAWNRRKEARRKEEMALAAAAAKDKQREFEKANRKQGREGDEGEQKIEVPGFYEVNGNYYLDGKLHEDKMHRDVDCEIFLEEEDEWVPAIITVVKEIAIAHTNLVQRKVSVQYAKERIEAKSLEAENESDDVAQPSDPDKAEEAASLSKDEKSIKEAEIKSEEKGEKEKDEKVIEEIGEKSEEKVGKEEAAEQDDLISKMGKQENGSTAEQASDPSPKKSKKRKRKSRWGPAVPEDATASQITEAAATIHSSNTSELKSASQEEVLNDIDKLEATKNEVNKEEQKDAPKKYDIITEEDVISERIRFIADKNGTWQGGPKVNSAPQIDDNTGIGGWQTVTVRTYDYKEEEARRKKEAKEQAKKAKRREKMLLEEHADAEDALSSFDPYKTGKYKGIDLDAEIEDIGGDEEEVPNISDKYVYEKPISKVSFKKKKKIPKGKFRKKKTMDD